MSNQNKAMSRRFGVGDLISDGETTGLVVGGFIDPADGAGTYTVIEPDGTLLSLTTKQVRCGIALADAARAVDLQGRNPLAPETSLEAMTAAANCTAMAVASAATSISATLAEGGAEWDSLNFLSSLSLAVKANAPEKSRVAKAFAEYERQWDQRGKPSWGAMNLAFEAWKSLGDEEQTRILNGWNHADTRFAEDRAEQLKNFAALSRSPHPFHPGPAATRPRSSKGGDTGGTRSGPQQSRQAYVHALTLRGWRVCRPPPTPL